MSAPVMSLPRDEWIREVDWSTIAKEFGTPVYVYSEEYIKNRAALLKNLFKGLPAELFYAMKANTNPEILRLLVEEGYGLESVSIFEAKLALEVAGDRRKILLTSCCLDDETLEGATRMGIKINADSWTQLHFLLHKGYHDTGVRLDLGFGEGHHVYTTTGGDFSKFGVDLEEFSSQLTTKLAELIRRVHFHLGSGIRSPETYAKALGILWDKVLRYCPFPEIDIGGGFYYPYERGEPEFDFVSLKRRLLEFIDFYEKAHGLIPKIILEPGRWVVAGGGVLLAKVTDLKSKGGRLFVTLNTGLHHLIRPALYRAYHEIVFVKKGNGFRKGLIAGNSCENSDVMPELRDIPNDLSRGDLALILDAGAYGYVMSSNYNAYPRPKEIIVRRGGGVEETRRFDELLNTLEE